MSFRSFDFTGIRHVDVDNLGSGSVSVDPGPGEDVVEGTLNCESESYLQSIEVRQERDVLRIRLPKGSSSKSVHLRLGAPHGLSYDVATGSADISITAEAGGAKVRTGSGDIQLDATAQLDASTGSGDLNIGTLHGPGKVTTGSGDVLIDEAHGPVQAKSGSGDVLIRTLRSELRGNSGSGDISVPSTTGSVDLRSASGSITVGVAEELPAWLDLDSVSGDIRIAIDAGNQPSEGEPYVTIRARTASGEIAVYRA